MRVTASRRRVRPGPACGMILPLVALCALGQPPSTPPSPLPNSPQISEPTPWSSEPLSLLQAPGFVRGSLRSPEGDAYEGASVELRLAGPLSPLRSTFSGSAGEFQFDNVPPGPFTLTISAPGFETRTISGRLGPGQSLEMPLVVFIVNRAMTEVRVSASPDEIATAQLHLEEQQRVLGIVPNFYVAYDAHAAPLSPAQKFHLSFKSLVDPTTFLGSLASAGLRQASRDPQEIGPGAKGFTQRFALDYGDNAIGTMIGSALLPTLLKQDPRYFYKGKGRVMARIGYAAAATVVCKGDNGHWQLNYSSILGGFAGAGISELYYPAADRKSATEILENFGIAKATGAFENVLQEFVVRRFTRRLPGFGEP